MMGLQARAEGPSAGPGGGGQWRGVGRRQPLQGRARGKLQRGRALAVLGRLVLVQDTDGKGIPGCGIWGTKPGGRSTSSSVFSADESG